MKAKASGGLRERVADVVGDLGGGGDVGGGVLEAAEAAQEEQVRVGDRGELCRLQLEEIRLDGEVVGEGPGDAIAAVAAADRLRRGEHGGAAREALVDLAVVHSHPVAILDQEGDGGGVDGGGG